jgi:hypothetical protein
LKRWRRCLAPPRGSRRQSAVCPTRWASKVSFDDARILAGIPDLFSYRANLRDRRKRDSSPKTRAAAYSASHTKKDGDTTSGCSKHRRCGCSGYQGLQRRHAKTSARAAKRIRCPQATRKETAPSPGERVARENVIAMLKRFKIIADRYRNLRRRFGRNLQHRARSNMTVIQEVYSIFWCNSGRAEAAPRWPKPIAGQEVARWIRGWHTQYPPSLERSSGEQLTAYTRRRFRPD